MKNTQVDSRSRKSRMAKSIPISTGRQKVLHNYHDHSQVTFPSEIDTSSIDLRDGSVRRGPRGGVSVPFPSKLHVMLSKVEEDGLSHIVSWQPHGRCFVVHKPKEFVSKVMPSFFRQSKLTSFQRQLNLYGFSRITTGQDRGGYYHELFLRHRLFLCQSMSRMRIKGTGIKAKSSPETEPNFYSMPPVKPEDASAKLDHNIEMEVIVALDEECNRSENTKQPSSKLQNGCNQKKQSAKKKAYKDESFETDSDDSSSSRNTSKYAVVTPDTKGSKKELRILRPSFDFGTNSFTHMNSRRRLSRRSSLKSIEQLIDLYPPLVSSSSEETQEHQLEPHHGDEIPLFGQHFHYLDSRSFEAPASSSDSFAFERKSRSCTTQQNQNISSLCMQKHEKVQAEAAKSLHEPILTPSTSSTSLEDLFKQNNCLEINPDTIFSDSSFYGDEWENLERVDIDAEFAMLARN